MLICLCSLVLLIQVIRHRYQWFKKMEQEENNPLYLGILHLLNYFSLVSQANTAIFYSTSENTFVQLVPWQHGQTVNSTRAGTLAVVFTAVVPCPAQGLPPAGTHSIVEGMRE